MANNMILDPTKLLLDSAVEEAKKLQKEKGLPEKGIETTQVLGLIVALGKIFDKIPDLAHVEKIHALEVNRKYIISVPPQTTQEDRKRLKLQLQTMGITALVVPFEVKFAEKTK